MNESIRDISRRGKRSKFIDYGDAESGGGLGIASIYGYGAVEGHEL